MNKIRKAIRQVGRSHQGMTLIEIMVVVTIIGIVATMGVVAVMKGLTKSKINIAKTQLVALKEQVEFYGSEHGDFPETLNALVEGDYINEKVLSDPWNRPYRLVVPGSDGSEFEIVSDGPKKNTSDDDISTADSDAGK